MQQEPGDDYIRKISAVIRANERNLAEAGFPRRSRISNNNAADNLSAFNPFTWFAPGQPQALKPVVLTLDSHHLFYLLIRMEAIGLDVGSLDVKVDAPSRPMSYINLFTDPDKSDTLSLASFRSSFSAVSRLSLGVGWWGRPEPPTLESELKYIFSSFTKLPALQISAPGPNIIAELVNDPPNENAIPMDSFKNLQSLECVDIDPRTLLGWDRLAVSLRSLKIKKSGLEDISDIFIGAVLDDQARRQGSVSRKRRRRINPPATVDETEGTEANNHAEPSTPIPTQLSSLEWAFLKQLSLNDNALTFLPSELFAYLTTVTHLDLSSNLFVSIPSGLGSLYNLVSLNIADNMIDSVLGIYQNLGQVLNLNLSRNRLDSICGLERLHALERVDLRENHIEESSEIGRLATLPNIAEVWVEGNPFIQYEEGYRVSCFEYFVKEGKTILLDGTPPGFYEKRYLTSSSPPLLPSARPISAVHSPPTVAVGHSHSHTTSPPPEPTPSTSANPPHPAAVGAVGVGKARRKKTKRIVDLDGNQSDGSIQSVRHRRAGSEPLVDAKVVAPVAVFAPTLIAEPTEEPSLAPPAPQPAIPRRPSRHSRHQTEYIDNDDTQDLPPLPSIIRSRGSQTFSSKSAARRARVSASVYEPPTVGDEDGDEGQGDADAFRRKIEALKKDMGDGWLKVFSQSQLKTAS